MLISPCPTCKNVNHLTHCRLKLNRYFHYDGFTPLTLCYSDEEFYMTCNKNDEDSIAFATLMMKSFTGIER